MAMNEGVGLEVALGKHLQAARQRAGMTQQQLCQKAGLSYSTLAKIERGAIKAPSIFTIEAIAEALGTSLDVLLDRTKPSQQLPVESPKKTSKNGVKFIYFDVNGCLVRFFNRAFARIAEDYNVSIDSVESTYWHYNDAVCRGEMPMDEFNKILAESIGVSHVNWAEYYLTSVDPIEEMHELLSWAAEHYHIGLITNIMPGLVPAMIERGLIPKLAYSTIVDSSVVKAIKPEVEMFEIAAAKAQCQPQEILLVDDARSNVMAAEKLGWKVIWFDDFRPAESAERIRKALAFKEPTLTPQNAAALL
jgi:FMN phosphatase YigB (HAD superfamily)/DNA-binding XRE family transcriptional regulator